MDSSAFGEWSIYACIGPLVNSHKRKGQHYVNFYRYKIKPKDSTNISHKQWKLFYEQTSHNVLFEIIFLLFCDYFLPMVLEFLNYKHPLMSFTKDLLQYFEDSSSLVYCVPAYPLFVTKNYCNPMHSDNDRSIYIMFFSSNISINTDNEHLISVEYEIKISTLDGDIFFIRGQDM